jgi:hypothetical protein
LKCLVASTEDVLLNFVVSRDWAMKGIISIFDGLRKRETQIQSWRSWVDLVCSFLGIVCTIQPIPMVTIQAQGSREAQRSNTRRPRNTYRIYYSLTPSSIRLNPVGRQVLSWRLSPQLAGTGEKGNSPFKNLLHDVAAFYSCLQIYPEPSCSGKALSPVRLSFQVAEQTPFLIR